MAPGITTNMTAAGGSDAMGGGGEKPKTQQSRSTLDASGKTGDALSSAPVSAFSSNVSSVGEPLEDDPEASDYSFAPPPPVIPIIAEIKKVSDSYLFLLPLIVVEV
jgi:hypothetical protein